MRKRWVLSGAAVLVAAAATGGVIAMSSAKPATPAAQEPPANTAAVERGRLSDTVSQYGTLTYRARSDGSPYPVFNQARGTYTKLPNSGDQIGCGGVLYRVNKSRWCCCVARRRRTGRCRRATADPMSPSSTPTWLTSGTRRERSSTRPLAPSASRRRPRSRSCRRSWARIRPGRWLSVGRCSCPSRCGSPTWRASLVHPPGRVHSHVRHIRHARGAVGPRSVAAG